MKLLTIQSLACYGKCSSTIALPVLSAMGIETTLLPTSLLSTHTGFSGFTFRDLTEDLARTARHWQALGVSFDAIYVGYLGSRAQLDFVLSLLAQHPRALVIVDPIMGDDGKLYSRITPDFVTTYRQLCRQADLIVPNLTEACALAGSDACREPSLLLQNLHALGAKNVVITGLAGENDTLGSLCLSEDGRLSSYFVPRIPGHYHGTGDMLASVLAGSLLRGLSLERALHLATDFVTACIRNTTGGDADGNHWDGLRFEPLLPQLISALSASSD